MRRKENPQYTPSRLTLATARHKEDGGVSECDTIDIYVCVNREFIIDGIAVFKWILFEGHDIRGII